MSATRIACLAVSVIFISCAAVRADWQMAKGPLVTQWAKDVSPQNALVEYPRPQMVRKEWVNLNGLWDYAITSQDAGAFPQKADGQILVPFPIESALSGVMKIVEPTQRLWYRRNFTAPALPAGSRLLLHFGAVDWESVVFLNGKQVGPTHRGGYDGFTRDITDSLKSSGEQELVVSVYDATNHRDTFQPRGKQNLDAARKPGGIWYTPTTGIWQTAWLEVVPQTYVQSIKITPLDDLSGASVAVSAVGGTCSVKFEALDGDKIVATGTATANSPKAPDGIAQTTLKVPNPKLWSPDSPNLYGLRVTILQDDKPVDVVDSYFGIRRIEMKKDDKGVNRLLLNGKFVFQVGPLDQGFWPDGLYTAPTDAALKFDIEITKKLGFNMARKHVKVEPERWYYWCDKLGLLVWQDMPSGDPGPRPQDAPPAAKPAKGVKVGNKERIPESAQQFETELKALIDGRYNHPCIVMWVVFNEGWGQYETERLTKWTKEYDPTRLANPASGWVDYPAGDVIDMHNYPGPGAPKAQENRAGVLGEFGGLGLPVEGHTWTVKHWGYRGTANSEALTRQYCKLLSKAWGLKDSAGLNACVYTQTTDVETECNGLLTYDRAVVKVDLARAAAANRGQAPPEPEIKEVAPTSRVEAQTWRFTAEKPADGWFKADFDASQWAQAPGGFGTSGTPGAVVGTKWNSSDIYLRREFILGEEKLNNPVILMHHDEDAEVYINGVLAVKVPGHISDYEQFDMSEEARAALKPGKNILAVHCHQTIGGQFIDVGIGVEVPPAKNK